MSLLHDLALLPPRRGAVVTLVFAVMATHLVLIDPWLLPSARRDAPAASMLTRQILLATPTQPPAPPSKAAPPAPRPQRTASRAAVPEAPTEPVAIEAGSIAPRAQLVPTYPTAPAPSSSLRFTVERGSQHGEATLDWSVEDNRYSLRLQAQLDGRPVLGSTSRGAFDAAGLAPERFVETRRQRELRAANFEREAGEIVFSGPGHRAELAPGAQDRLSWWLQLAAVLHANPALHEVTLSVTGARGDSRVWTFVEVPSTHDDAAGLRPDGLRHFQRAAQHPYDTEVDVWLDAAAHHLPARLRLLFRQGGDATVFTRVADR